jgi:hypothetical protein
MGASVYFDAGAAVSAGPAVVLVAAGETVGEGDAQALNTSAARHRVTRIDVVRERCRRRSIEFLLSPRVQSGDFLARVTFALSDVAGFQCHL